MARRTAHMAHVAWVAPPGFVLGLSNVVAALVWITAAPILLSVAVVVSAHVLRLMPDDEPPDE